MSMPAIDAVRKTAFRRAPMRKMRNACWTAAVPALRSNAPVRACRPGMGRSCRQAPMRGRTQASGGSRVDDALLRRMAAVIVDEVDPDQVILSGW